MLAGGAPLEEPLPSLEGGAPEKLLLQSVDLDFRGNKGCHLPPYRKAEKTYYVSPSLQHVYEHVCLYLFSLSHPWPHNQRHHRPRNNLPCGASVRGSWWTLACKTSRSQDIFRKLGAHRWSGYHGLPSHGDPDCNCLEMALCSHHKYHKQIVFSEVRWAGEERGTYPTCFLFLC